MPSSHLFFVFCCLLQLLAQRHPYQWPQGFIAWDKGSRTHLCSHPRPERLRSLCWIFKFSGQFLGGKINNFSIVKKLNLMQSQKGWDSQSPLNIQQG